MERKFEKETEFIKTVIPSWKDLQMSEISCEALTGGTRELYKVTALKKGIEPEIVLMRKFRQYSDPELGKIEAYWYQLLSTNGLGPRCFGQNDECRVEEFLEGRTLTTKELTDKVVRRRLAMQLGKLHSLSTDIMAGMHIVTLGLAKLTPVFQQRYAAKAFDEVDMPIIEEIKYLYDKEEVEYIQSILKKYDDTVLGHNDLWSTNILFNEKTSDLAFIDFETMGPTFSGIDLGRILLEAVFHRDRPGCAYELREGNFPSEEDIKDFLRYYLVSRNKGITDKAHADSVARDPALLEEIEKKLFPNKEDHEAALKKVERLVVPGIIVSSFFILMAIGAVIHKEIMTGMDYYQNAKDIHAFYKKYKAKLEKSME